MSHFYGVVSGQARTLATRGGSKKSGMNVVAASWDGAIETVLYYDPVTEKNRYQVLQKPWHGHGISKVLAEGVVGE